jgi:hypothetical protein
MANWRTLRARVAGGEIANNPYSRAYRNSYDNLCILNFNYSNMGEHDKEFTIYYQMWNYTGLIAFTGKITWIVFER